MFSPCAFFSGWMGRLVAAASLTLWPAVGIGGPLDRILVIQNYLLLSSGAPVPEDPRNSFRPSGKVTSRPLALFDPSLA
jgi:hypothetical protein